MISSLSIHDNINIMFTYLKLNVMPFILNTRYIQFKSREFAVQEKIAWKTKIIPPLFHNSCRGSLQELWNGWSTLRKSKYSYDCMKLQK